MMTTSQALQTVNNLSALHDIAKVVLDPEKIAALRSEFQVKADDLVSSEKQAQDRISAVLTDEAVNKSVSDALAERQKVIDAKEKELDQEVDQVNSTVRQLDIRDKKLREDREAFNKAQSDWTAIQNKKESDLNITKQQWQEQVRAKEVILQKREYSVQVREETLTQKEGSLFKKTQLIASLKDSLG